MALIGTGGDQPWPPPAPERKPAVKEYDVDINGVITRLQLSDEDAKARGLTTTAKAKTPANKARTAATKREEAADKSFGQTPKKTAK